MTDIPWKPNRHTAAGFFHGSAAALLCTAILSANLGGPSKSTLMFGLSGERLALLSGMLVLFCGLIFLGVQIMRGKSFGRFWPEHADNRARIINSFLGITALVFACAWWLTWTPADSFGDLFYYFVRFYPFIVWLSCVSGVGVALLLASQFGVDVKQFQAFMREQRNPLMIAGAALLLFGLISWLVSFRVVGMRWQDEDFWYGAGVPLLPLQVLGAVAACIGLVIVAKKFFARRKIEKKYWVDLVLFMAIWAIAAWFWANEPVNPDFFITKPTAPNYELYPDYDAKFFDEVSQYALIGQGLNNRVLYDRPLYSALLVYIHSLAGQNYVRVVALQAGLFAIFPALGYLLGKRIHSRTAGVGLAILFTMRGMNAIDAGPLINTSTPKQMLTDFPSAILMLLLTLLVVRWLQEPWTNWRSIGVAGGVVGLATLVRPHPLVFFPLLIPLVIWVYRRKSKLWASMSVLLLAAALAGILPWLVSNGQGTSIIDLYLGRIKNVIQQRYQGIQPTPSSGLAPAQKVAATNLQDLHFAAVASPTAQKSVFAFSVDNFLNNLTTATQILPYTPYYQDLEYTVKNSESFWRPYWDGSMSPWAMTILPINLILIALGIGTAWKRARLSGMIPMGVMLAYFTMNALARTSGGRYLVPVDWVVILYYFVGILTVIEIIWAFCQTKLFPQESAPTDLQTVIPFNRRTWASLFGIVGLFVLMGALIPLSGSFFERRYTPISRSALAQQLKARAGNELSISDVEWNNFISNPAAVIRQGRILYPRQFDKDQGWAVSMYQFYRPKPYPRMLFTLLGPQGETSAIFPTTQAIPIENASDAIILGCRQNDYVQVWGILGKNGELFRQTPSTSLVCPLPEPVCDNNHHCK